MPHTLWTHVWSSSSLHALRCSLPRLFLHARDERAQRRRRRLGRARRARRRGGQRQTHVGLGEALVRPDVLAPPNDAIGKRDARRAAHEFPHLEARGALAAHREPAAVALGRDEHAIVAALDYLAEVGVEPDNRAPAL